MNRPTLIVSHTDSDALDDAVPRLLGAARNFPGARHVLVFGSARAAEQASRLDGVDEVLRVDARELNAETAARVLVALAPGHGAVLAAHRMLWRSALPRAAAQVGAAYLSDVTAVHGAQRVSRSMYAGSVVATLETLDPPWMTVRTALFEPVGAALQAAPVREPEGVPGDPRARLLGREVPRDDRPDLGRARVVVSAGRGVGGAQHMHLVESLADTLHGAVGASRAAVDAGYAPNTLQVGQTGRTIAPEVYIAVGISGAIQHLAGIKDAGTIVAINKDPDAPIFSVADIGLVGDLFEVLPRLNELLQSRRC